jgi:hypothetical protein
LARDDQNHSHSRHTHSTCVPKSHPPVPLHLGKQEPPNKCTYLEVGHSDIRTFGFGVRALPNVCSNLYLLRPKVNLPDLQSHTQIETPIITYPQRGTTTCLTDLQTWRGRQNQPPKAHTLTCVPSHTPPVPLHGKTGSPPTSTYLEVGPLRYKNLLIWCGVSNKCTVCATVPTHAQRSTFLTYNPYTNRDPNHNVPYERYKLNALTDLQT